MTQVRVHLDRLQQMEYVIAHQGGRGLTFEYELACDPDQIHGYDSNLAGSEGQLAGSKRPQNGGVAGGSRSEETRIKPASDSVFDGNRKKRALTEA